MAVKLHDQAAVITGAGNGIGKAIAIAMAKAGAKVVIADIKEEAARRTADQICEFGGKAIAVVTNVADPAAVDQLAGRAAEAFGEISILVNDAAIQVSKTVVDTTFDEWNQMMAINVGGVFLCSRKFLPMLKRTRGVIINLSSVNGYFVEPMCAGYCATKAAILGLTKAMAIDHGREGVRVHSICPGYIDTGLAQGYFDAQSNPAQARAEAGNLHALGRVGRAEEIARVAVFLASDDASFMTGSPVIVDGGFSVGLPPK